MIKKALLSLAAALLTLSAYAIPAAPKAQVHVQPDGTTVTVKLHGDEFYHYATTLDGYTIALNRQGYYVYAEKVDSRMELIAVAAHDLNARDAVEQAFVGKLTKYEIDRGKVDTGHKLREKRNLGPGLKERPFDFSKFHGLVILVNYNDQSFSRSDAHDFYNRMINEENYSGFTNEDGSPNPYGRFTGSVRDYFCDNSGGEFVPQFDVVGPVDVTGFGINDGGEKSDSVFMEAMDLLDPDIDFSKYDNDGDGQVDMVYFIVPGSGANSDPDHPDHLWPYMSNFSWYDITHDDKRLGRYACSTEFLYNEEYGLIDGIGVICHEFSHVLGLPDLYDTDYSGSNGQSHDPGEWDVMSGGSYGNYSRTPVAYSLYDRYALGFANPQVITETGSYSLQPVSTTGDGYILLTPNAKEKFLLDNRQTSLKWDSSCPGHGMIIARMDSTNLFVWRGNRVNCDPKHNYYELLRAGNSTSGDQPSDAFPGTKNVTFLNNNTTPNLKTWTKKGNVFAINKIQEKNGVIYFDVVDGSVTLIDTEDFEPMPVSDNLKETEVMGSLTDWDFNQCHVAEVTGTNTGNGTRSVAMIYPSALTTHTPLYYDAYIVEYDVYNPTGATAKFTCKASADGSKWSTLKLQGDATNTVNPGEKVTLTYSVNYNVPMYYRINQIGGDKTNPCYIDDFRIYYNEMDELIGDVNGDGEVNVGDVAEVYKVIIGTSSANAFRADVNFDGEINTGDVSELYGIIIGGGSSSVSNLFSR